MIGGVYSKSDISPGILPVDEEFLLGSVLSSEVTKSVRSEGKIAFISVELPFGCNVAGTVGAPTESNGDSTLMLGHIFVTDTRLIGSGTGTRLVRAFAELAIEVSPTCETMHSGWARLGAINALQKAFPDMVRVELLNDPSMHYGFGTDKTLEQMLIENPPKEGEAFMAWGTTTRIS